MSAQCDLTKKKAPQTYPAFGEKLFSIAAENLPRGGIKEKNSVVTYFRNQADLGFDTSCTYAWLRGDVLGSKPLVPENFKRVLLFYMGKKGLNTIEEINAWIALGPTRFEDVLCSDEIQSMLHAKKILIHVIDQGEEMAERQKLWERLTQLVRSASVLGSGTSKRRMDASLESRLIVIQGPPGVGKTMLLERLLTDPGIQSCFDEVSYASCDSQMPPQTFLDFWIRMIQPDNDWHPDSPHVLKSDLQKAIQGKRMMLLADNVSSHHEIQALKPLCESGCLVVVATRCLEVARQADYSNVVEMTAYSRSDVMEYYSKNYVAHPSLFNQEKLIQLAEMVCYNPLGLNIALRRVAEEGWETVMQKVCLVPSICKQDVFKDLHKPFWLAYSSLSLEDQDKFRSLGVLPNLASYDEERLGLFWGISNVRTNEILVRLEKEAGLARRSSQKKDQWHFHPQVLNYARCLLRDSSFRKRFLARFYAVRLALHQRRPGQFHHLYKRGVKPDILRTYFQMIQKEGRQRRLPIILAELRRLVDPTYSTDWSIFTQLASNCTLEDYIWGYRNYLEGGLDIICFCVYLFLIGVQGGLQSLEIQLGALKQVRTFFGVVNLSLLSFGLVWAFHIVLRDFRRRYDWAQLWQKVTANHKESREN